MSEELRPCPFCGTLPQANTWVFYGISETRYFCPNQECPLSVRTSTLERWNRRPIEDALTARIAKLEAEVTRLLTESDDAHMAEARYIAKAELAKRDARIAELEAEIDQLTAHSDIERQDDKCSGHGDISNFPPVMGSGDGLGW